MYTQGRESTPVCRFPVVKLHCLIRIAFSVSEKQKTYLSVLSSLKSHQYFGSGTLRLTPTITIRRKALCSGFHDENLIEVKALLLLSHCITCERVRSPARMMLSKHKQAATALFLQLWIASPQAEQGVQKSSRPLATALRCHS